MDPQRIIDVCEANWEAHKSDCSGFVKAVCSTLGVSTFAGGEDANQMVDTLQAATDWTPLTPGDGAAAKSQADAGLLVIAGLKGADQAKPHPHGHVVVVVSGPLERQYPTGYWGKLHGVGAKAKTINWAWSPGDRDKVGYFTKSLGVPPSPPEPPGSLDAQPSS